MNPPPTKRKLNTTTRQVIILGLIASLILACFIVPVGYIITQKVMASLDADLRNSLDSLRASFVAESYYLRDEARVLAGLESIEEALESHDDVELRQLMAVFKGSHNFDGTFLLGPDGKVFSTGGMPDLSPEDVSGLALVEKGLRGENTSEPVIINGRLWLMAVAPRLARDGRIDSVFVVSREINSSYLTGLSTACGADILLSAGDVVIGSKGVGYDNAPLYQKLLAAIDTGGSLRAHTVRADGKAFRLFSGTIASTNDLTVTATVIKSTDLIDETVRSTAEWVGVLGLIFIILILLAVWFHADKIFRPLQELVISTQHIAAGDWDEPLEAKGVADVYSLAVSFDIMRQRLKEMADKQTKWSEELERTVAERSRELEEVCHARERLLAALVSAQEAERKRIGRELHDEIAQDLAYLVVNLATLGRLTEDDDLRKKLEFMKERAQQTLESVQRVVLDLRPGMLDDLGLMAAIRWYAQERLEAKGIKVRIEGHGTPVSSSAYTEINIFRIVQEALNNIVRHSEATEASVDLTWNESRLLIEIRDNGKGFDAEAALRRRADNNNFGLLGMRERVEMMDGTLFLDSAPGEGTRIFVEIPFTTTVDIEHVIDSRPSR